MALNTALDSGPDWGFEGAPSALFPIAGVEPLVAWLSLSAAAGRRTDQALWQDTWLWLAQQGRPWNKQGLTLYYLVSLFSPTSLRHSLVWH